MFDAPARTSPSTPDQPPAPQFGQWSAGGLVRIRRKHGSEDADTGTNTRLTGIRLQPTDMINTKQQSPTCESVDRAEDASAIKPSSFAIPRVNLSPTAGLQPARKLSHAGDRGRSLAMKVRDQRIVDRVDRTIANLERRAQRQRTHVGNIENHSIVERLRQQDILAEMQASLLRLRSYRTSLLNDRKIS
jgi:hypothetical protein